MSKILGAIAIGSMAFGALTPSCQPSGPSAEHAAICAALGVPTAQCDALVVIADADSTAPIVVDPPQTLVLRYAPGTSRMWARTDCDNAGGGALITYADRYYCLGADY